MNRLTTKDTINNLTEIVGFEGFSCPEVCEYADDCDKCIIHDAFMKLYQYENTGLHPEEISAMMAENTELIERLADCESADQDLENVFLNYVALYKAIHVLQNGGILNEEETQVCEHNLLFQIIRMMQANTNIEGSESK